MSRFDSLVIEPSVVDAFKRGERGAAERVYGVLSKAVYGLTLRLLSCLLLKSLNDDALVEQLIKYRLLPVGGLPCPQEAIE